MHRTVRQSTCRASRLNLILYELIGMSLKRHFESRVLDDWFRVPETFFENYIRVFIQQLILQRQILSICFPKNIAA